VRVSIASSYEDLFETWDEGTSSSTRNTQTKDMTATHCSPGASRASSVPSALPIESGVKLDELEGVRVAAATECRPARSSNPLRSTISPVVLESQTPPSSPLEYKNPADHEGSIICSPTID